MRSYGWAILMMLASGLAARGAGIQAAGVLQPGQVLVLRVLQVIPGDDLSPGERILNSRKPLAVGDRFLAEVVRGPLPSQVLLGGTDLSALDDGRRTLLRRTRIGFVFQAFNLLPMLTAAENITLPADLAGIRPEDRKSVV